MLHYTSIRETFIGCVKERKLLTCVKKIKDMVCKNFKRSDMRENE
jgi:hypothetical protein